MTRKIPLHVRGIDLRDVAAYERIPEDLLDLDWKAAGAVSLAVVYVDGPDAVSEAIEAARRIQKHLSGVTVVGVHDELVTLGDVAVRCSVADEAVRLWAAGKRRASGRAFPGPRQVVSASAGKSTSLYAWREVVSWVREVVRVDPDEGIDYLDDAGIAEVNAEIAGYRSPGWSSPETLGEVRPFPLPAQLVAVETA